MNPQTEKEQKQRTLDRLARYRKVSDYQSQLRIAYGVAAKEPEPEDIEDMSFDFDEIRCIEEMNKDYYNEFDGFGMCVEPEDCDRIGGFHDPL